MILPTTKYTCSSLSSYSFRLLWNLLFRTCERLRLMLRELGFRSTALHAQMSQNDRLGSLAKFKTEIVKILITTDVGSRYE